MKRLIIVAMYLMMATAPACSESSETIATMPTDSQDADTSTDDTGSNTETDTVPSSGVSVGNALWYLGEPGASCTDTCADHGGYDEATATYAGDDDSVGDYEIANENCAEVLLALGIANPNENNFVSCTTADSGAGCYYADWNTEYPHMRQNQVPTTADGYYIHYTKKWFAARACACLN